MKAQARLSFKAPPKPKHIEVYAMLFTTAELFTLFQKQTINEYTSDNAIQFKRVNFRNEDHARYAA